MEIQITSFANLASKVIFFPKLITKFSCSHIITVSFEKFYNDKLITGCLVLLFEKHCRCVCVSSWDFYDFHSVFYLIAKFIKNCNLPKKSWKPLETCWGMGKQRSFWVKQSLNMIASLNVTLIYYNAKIECIFKVFEHVNEKDSNERSFVI